MLGRIGVLLVLMLVFAAGASSQDLPDGEVVQIAAADGLSLWGEYYDSGSSYSVLMMHSNGSNRSAWGPLIPQLMALGYNALTVDLRGHGDTGGTKDWAAATDDAGLWMNWLAERSAGADSQVAIIGSSIGSNLALVTCPQYETCETVVALSPGEDYFGIMPEAAFQGGLSQRAVFLVASRGDRYSAESIFSLAAAGSGDVALRNYSGSEHGTNIFLNAHNGPSLINSILAWMEEQMPVEPMDAEPEATATAAAN